MHDWSGTYQAWGPAGHMGSFGPEGWMLAAFALAAPFILVALLWTVVWKGFALWHAARRGQYWWFLILLVVNTLGILEIIYLFFVAGLKLKEVFAWPPAHSSHSNHSGHSHS